MGYMHIDNLYKDQRILLFKRCYALEKIHGTSAHVSWNGAQVKFFSGGEAYEKFKALFDEAALTEAFRSLCGDAKATVYGEAYGGKQQGMSKTYGDKLKFVVFDVCFGEGSFVDVPKAEAFAKALGLEFVDYVEVPAEVAELGACRDAPSVQAVRNGIAEPRVREGVVLRPLHECVFANGKRVIAKHKAAAFAERKTPQPVDEAAQRILDDATAVADEWVIPMRLTHVLDKLSNPTDLSETGKVIAAMVEDVMREAAGEVEDTKAVRKAIGAAAARLFKEWVASLPAQ